MGLISHSRNLFLTLRLVDPRGNPSGLAQLALTVTIHVSVPANVTEGIHPKYLTLLIAYRTCTCLD